MVLRLMLSALAGGIVGMERESNNRPAGLRTHILVTLGATLVMILSMYGFEGMGPGGAGGDPGRMAAQVVSGIGFLGAGTILRTGNSISGLTTAASIWVCGCIGLAIGNGYYFGGILTTIIVFLSLRGSSLTERMLFKRSFKELVIHCKERPGLLGDIDHIMCKNNIVIKDIRVVHDSEVSDQTGEITVRFRLKLPSKFINERFFSEILIIKGVKKALWEGEKEA